MFNAQQMFIVLPPPLLLMSAGDGDVFKRVNAKDPEVGGSTE